MFTRIRELASDWRGYILALLFVAATTALFVPGREYFAKGQWALLYLLVVVFVARLSGTRPAILAALAAFLTWNYFFLPPYYALSITDPKDWLSLFVFLIVGLSMGLQTGRLREREGQARARERDAALLNRFSAHLVSELTVTEMADILATEVTGSVKAGCAILFTPAASGNPVQVESTPATRCTPDARVTEMVKWVSTHYKAIGLPPFHKVRSVTQALWPVSVLHRDAGLSGPELDIVIPLQTATKHVGVLYLGAPMDGRPYSVTGVRLLVAIANQAAAFLERKQLQSVAIQADALREADHLKSTLISSVSHELKTPLASITATVSNLLENDLTWDESSIRSELGAVQEDLDRLNDSISALVDLSRLESSAWNPNRDWYELGEILGTVLSKIPQTQRQRIEFRISDDLPQICVDYTQWTRVLRNLLENALAYSGPDQPVYVGASATGKEIRIWVEDRGPGVLPEERDRVFEKFYRGAVSAGVPSGTGLGLAITREIVRFHEGRIQVEDVQPHGARFVIYLPR
jgi:two-component system sensor histidine kinase KdpD